ncbi:ATP phosphoribosyltransferase [Ignicoccus islandicus DSM 13165]|uniref:ATP phosphoribosyltransferase n=1 Tax=Ignicoccus islandicus DSM 13165 TaxID=940295 RepID=A0A0U3EC44_9CREN|nr:ATP phosphoribosyltransferase [Ignicoccus islandicus]ALU12035.1 ATP phosphoribosyltransferase [Ignicoccus islandicus DSM 13165]
MKIAVPSKGRLRDKTLELLEAAGFGTIYADPRALIIPTKYNGIDLVFVRPEDIPWIVESGAAQMGITGHDYVVEAGVEVEEVLDLGYGNSRLVLAVPNNLGIEKAEELPEGTRVATKFVNISKKFINERNLKWKIIKISGSAEIMPGLGAADAIIDISSTGTTLRLHGLKAIEVLLESSARLIVNKEFVNDDKVELVKTMIEGVLKARKKKLLMMNVPERSLKEVLSVLPSMSGPTISKVESTEPMWEVIVAIDESELNDVIMKVKSSGARDILVVNIERLIP